MDMEQWLQVTGYPGYLATSLLLVGYFAVIPSGSFLPLAGHGWLFLHVNILFLWPQSFSLHPGPSFQELSAWQFSASSSS